VTSTIPRPRGRRLDPSLSPAPLALLVGIAFSIVAFWAMRGWERALAAHEIQDRFQERAEHASLRLQERVSRHLAALEGVEALFEASTEVTRAEFDTFTRGLVQQNPSIRQLAWAPRVRADDRESFESRVRLEVPGFAVHAGDAPSGSVLFPVDYTAPVAGPADLGLDLGSVRALQDALAHAASTGRGTTVGPLPLAPLGGGDSVGVAVFLPFYRAGTEGTPALQGFVVELLDLGSILAATAEGLDAWLSDTTGRPALAWRAGSPIALTAPPTVGLVRRSGLTLDDQVWTVALALPEGPAAPAAGMASWTVLIVGCGASTVGAVYLARLRRFAADLSTANVAFTQEMTRRRAAEETRERLSGVLEETSDLVAMADPGDHLLYLNRAGHALVGIDEHEELGRTLLTDLLSPASRARLPRGGDAVASWQGEIELRRRDDGEIPALGVLQTHLDPDGEVAYRSVIAHDIRERKAAELRLERHAYHDELTDLPNRRMLERRLEETLAEAHGGRVAVLLVNPDRFRLVSFSLGPAYHDLTMRALARRLQTLVRPGETLAHYVGDTFALILPGGTLAQVHRVRDALFEAMAEPLLVDGAEIRLGISIGACFSPEDGGSVAELLRHADAALNHATELGGGTCQFFTGALHQQLQDRLTLEAELRTALEHDELTLYYQPQVDLASGALAGVEALLRWHHPRLGLLGPAGFVKIAERSRLILPIGDWVLEHACRQAAAWRRAGGPTLKVGVNVSAYQLGQVDLDARIRGAMRASALRPGELEIELTESALMADPGELRELLGRLRDNGCRIAIDDFGTGYSCLSYLKQLPVDRLKIDQSFIRDVATDASSSGIVRAIIVLARQLGLTTIAEGVSDPAQVAFLRTEGCPEIQGYVVSAPVPPEDIPPLLDGLRSRPFA
jgi:diguanylate cyclase (GGDEF)-like protein/PAS domain S-box-containing protein